MSRDANGPMGSVEWQRPLSVVAVAIDHGHHAALLQVLDVLGASFTH